MSLILTPKRLARQPQGALRLNRSNPLTRGLAFFWTGSAPNLNLVSGRSQVKINALGSVATPRGIEADNFSPISGSSRYIQDSSITGFSGVGTFISGGAAVSGTTAMMSIGKAGEGLMVGTVSGSAAVTYLGVAVYSSTITIPTGPVVIGAAISSSAARIHAITGSTYTVQQVSVGTPNVTAEPLRVGIQGGGDTWTGSIGWGLYYPSRTLTDAEMFSIMSNPWQLLEYETFSFAPPVGIAFDAAANSGYQAAASTYTFDRTATGSDRFLAIDVSLLSAGQTVTSIVDDFGGTNVNAIFVGACSTVTSFGRVEMWRVIGPVAGTKTIQVNLSGSIASAATAASYTGVHQTSPVEGFNSAQATNVGAADATVDITTVADNCWVHGAVATDDGSITAVQTSRNNVSGVGGSGANEDNNGPKTPAGAVTMSWTGVAALATWAIGGYAIRPVAASTLNTYTLTAAVGTYTLTGVAAGLAAGRKITAAVGTYTLTGVAAALQVARKMTAGTGSYALTGNAATLTYTPVGATYTITLATGSYVLTGNSAALQIARKMAAGVGSYALTGSAANVTAARKITAGVGAYTLTGNAAGLAAGRKLTAGTGVYSLIGNAVSLSVISTIFRASIVRSGLLEPITDAEVGTGLKAVVYISGRLRQRLVSEGTPIIIKPDGTYRLLGSGETLRI